MNPEELTLIRMRQVVIAFRKAVYVFMGVFLIIGIVFFILGLNHVNFLGFESNELHKSLTYGISTFFGGSEIPLILFGYKIQYKISQYDLAIARASINPNDSFVMDIIKSNPITIK